MKSRLAAYLSGMKLARLHLSSAKEFSEKGRVDSSYRHMIAALEEVITANNNLASIAFNARPKRNSK